LPFRNISTTEAAYYAKNLATKEALLGYARHDLARALMVIDTRTAAYTRRFAQRGGTAPDRPFTYSRSSRASGKRCGLAGARSAACCP
jgi:hypothetical protein